LKVNFIILLEFHHSDKELLVLASIVDEKEKRGKNIYGLITLMLEEMNMENFIHYFQTFRMSQNVLITSG